MKNPGWCLVLSIVLACSGGATTPGTTVTAADGDVWSLARRAETAMRDAEATRYDLRNAVVGAIRGSSTVPSTMISAFTLADAKLVDLDAKLDAALVQRAPQGHAVSRALLHAAVIYRRAQVAPFQTTVLGLAGLAACRVDVSADHILLDHLLALVERRFEEASIYLARLDQTIRCLSIHQIWSVDAQLAIALESLPALSRDEARAARAHLLPLLLVVLDASKINGTTPLMQHLSGHTGDYLDAALVEKGLIADFGIWLHDPRRSYLAQFPSICELPTPPSTTTPVIPRCVQLGALLDALTNPERLGTGECPAFAMITAGMTNEGGYACRGGQCAAASAPSLGGTKPAKPAIDRLIAGGNRTAFGFDIPRGSAAAVTGSCGSGGAGGGGGRGQASAGQHSCAIASLVAGESSNVVAGCAAEAIAAAGQVFQIPAIQLATHHVSPTCMRSGGASANATPEQKERDKTAKQEAKNALDHPEVQQKIRDQLKSAYGREPTQAEMDAAITAAKKAIDDAVVDRDKGLPGDKAGNTDCRSGTCFVTIDGKKTDKDAAMIFEVMFHEGLHAALYSLGVRGKYSGDHHDIMTKSGLARPKLPDPYWYMCAPDSQCANTCNPTSVATVDVAGCVIGAVVDSSTPDGKPSNIDPSPLDPPQVTSALSKCFRDSMNIGINKVPPQCMAVDCGPDGSATLNAAGICTCGASGTPGKLRPQLMAQCNAMRCEGGMPTSGPVGCTCAASMGKLGKLSVTPVSIRIR